MSRRLLITSLATGIAVAALAVTIAPEALRGPCTHRDTLMAEFDVERRAEILEAIPDLRRAPELAEDDVVLADGRSVYPAVADFHVAIYQCLEYGLLPLFPPLGPWLDPPQDLRHVVIVTVESEVTIYSGVDFRELQIPAPVGVI